MASKVEYLGDSVYGDYSTGDLRLYTDNGEGPTNEIIINGDVLTAFFKHIERCLCVKINVRAAAQEKEESGGTSLNSGYTTALEVCLRSLKLSKIIDIREGSILKVAACLNYVVKAQQNCA